MRSGRRWLLGLLLSIMVPATAFAAQDILSSLPTVNVLVNGKQLQGVLLDGKTMVPLRSLAEAIGATIEWDQSTRTATVTMGANPPATTTGPAAMTSPSGSQEIEVQSYSFRTTRYGDPWAYVEFKNSGNTPEEDVKVSMLATKDGNIVAAGSQSLGSHAVLKPGEAASVWVKPSNEIPQGAVLEWTFSSKPSTREVPKLKVNSTAVTKGDFGWAHGIGSVTNTDTRAIENLQVIVAFHDASGRIIYSCMNTDVALRTLEPGQTTVFDATAVDISPTDVSNITVYVTADYVD